VDGRSRWLRNPIKRYPISYLPALNGCIGLLKQIIPILEKGITILDETMATRGLRP